MSTKDASSHVRGVRFEHHPEALGIGEATPRVSWRVETSRSGWRQVAYEIEVAEVDEASAASPRDPGGSAAGDRPADPLVQRSGRIEDGESLLRSWPAPPLRSRDRRDVRVRVWGRTDDGAEPQATDWSGPVRVEAGLLEPAEDWHAALIGPDHELEGSPAPQLRGTFEVGAEVVRARLYATAHGVYDLELNGQPVGDHVLDPGWTSYHHRLRVYAFDVTDLVHRGANAIGAFLGDGWFRERLGFGQGRSAVYGDRIGLAVQLELHLADGQLQRVVTSEDWRWRPGPIHAASLYDGETYDAREDTPGWSEPGLDAIGWEAVRPLAFDPERLVAPTGPPVRRIELVEPVEVLTSPSGATIVDLGQNLVGRMRLRVSGPAGTTVTLSHAEVLEDGELCRRPLRGAEAVDRYTLRGEGAETYEPRFTFHGFRYVQVDGWPGDLDPADLVAVVCQSDLERTGWFACSEPDLERLHDNVVWSLRGNTLDVPTDCPQRDERLGWTGDLQVFAPTAAFLYDCAGFLSSWLADLAAEQADHHGVVPHIVPFVDLTGPLRPAAAWGDAAVIVPWVLFQRYGDLALLTSQYDSMCAWVDAVAEHAGDDQLVDEGFQYGDWLDPTAPPDRPGDAATDQYLVATAYHARSAELVATTARLLGHRDDAERYDALTAQIRAAFVDEFVTPSGRVVSDAQTAYALALEFALLPLASQRDRAARRLVELVRAGGHRIRTGFIGTPLMCDALTHAGALDDAYRLLLQRACPSWLYPVTMGATTVWERWDSLLPDGQVNPGEMTSFNHYALGAIADWLHRTVAGLAPGAPGYRVLEVAPRPGGGLTAASASHHTPYGRAEVAWTREGTAFDLRVVVPPSTEARISLPDGAPTVTVAAGEHRFTAKLRHPDTDPKPDAAQ